MQVKEAADGFMLDTFHCSRHFLLSRVQVATGALYQLT
jgi:hypothetical protein